MIPTEATRPNLLAQLPQLIADEIKVVLPKLRMCEAKTGGLDLDEIKRMGAQAPAVFVTRRGLRPDRKRPDTQAFFMAEMAAFVATKNQGAINRTVSAQAISQAILIRAFETSWSIPECGPAQDLAEDVIETEATRKAQIALIAITWLQPIALTKPVSQEPLIPELYVGFAPDIGADNVGAYDEIEAVS